MDSFEKIRRKKLACIIMVYALTVLLGVICIMTLKEYLEEKRYYIPETDKNAEYGIPSDVELEELTPKEKIRIGFHNNVYVEEDKLYVYLTNYKESEVLISAFLYDEDKKMYANSGIIKQEHFLPYLIIDNELMYGKEYYLNIAFYKMEDMTSEGSIWIRIGELRKGK